MPGPKGLGLSGYAVDGNKPVAVTGTAFGIDVAIDGIGILGG